VTQSRFGAVAVNSRFTRSGCRADAGSGLVVLIRFEPLTPSIPQSASTGRSGLHCCGLLRALHDKHAIVCRAAVVLNAVIAWVKTLSDTP